LEVSRFSWLGDEDRAITIWMGDEGDGDGITEDP
jgi:hypothetical protein